MRLFCFGYGYSAEALARRLSPRLAELAGTRTNPEPPTEAGAVLAAYKGDGPSPAVEPAGWHYPPPRQHPARP